MLWMVLAFAASFFLGSIPHGLWVGRLVRGIDVREHGSKNLGATNVYRVLGPKWGLLVLFLDAGKGAAAVALSVLLAQTTDLAGTSWPGLIGMLGAFLGHMFTPLAGFRGGKGVATGAGAWAALVPMAFLIALSAWIFFFMLRRIVSLASIAAAIVLPFAVAATIPPPVLGEPLFWLSVVTCGFVVWRHRGNMSRLIRGEEKALALKGSKSGGAESGEGTR